MEVTTFAARLGGILRGQPRPQQLRDGRRHQPDDLYEQRQQLRRVSPPVSPRIAAPYTYYPTADPRRFRNWIADDGIKIRKSWRMAGFKWWK